MRDTLKKEIPSVIQLVKSVRLQAHHFDDDSRNDKVLRNNINLLILSKLGGEERNTLLPGTVDGGILTLRNKDIRIDLKAIQKNLPASYRIARPELKFRIPDEIRRLCSISEMQDAEEPALRLVAIANPVDNWANGQRTEATPNRETEEKRITEQLAYVWGVGHDLSEDIPLPDNGSIHPYPFDGFFASKGDRYIFRTEHGAVIYSVERRMVAGRWVELPVTNYISGNGDEFPAYRMPLRHGNGRYPFLHLDFMARYPDTPVFLTEMTDLAFEFNQPDEKRIVSSFYGGLDTISYTDVRPLFGNQRKTYFLLLNPPGCMDEPHTWQIALKLLENFRKYDRTLRFILPESPKWKSASSDSPHSCSCRSFKELTTQEVLRRCRAFKLFVPECLQSEELQILSGSEAEFVPEEKPFIVPIANEGSLAIFYGNAKTGKTFLALHIALAMAYGNDPFPGRWLNAAKTPHRVLYVSGEMTKGIFKKRKKREDQSLRPTSELKNNIQFVHLRGWSIADTVDQKDVDRCIEAVNPELIVFDNWQSLCGDAPSSRGMFDQFYRWVSKWLDAGVHVQLINHTTKDGVILGSGALKAQCDMAIRLYRASDDDKIRILVTTDDVRDGKRSLFSPFIAEYDFDKNGVPWQIRIPKENEIQELIHWNDGGCKDIFPMQGKEDTDEK